MFELPKDVVDYVARIFRECNARVSAKLSRIPTAHETSLDLTLIEHFSRFAAPVALESQWVVRTDVHFLGGSRHYGRWEIADLGVLLIFRRRSALVRSKVGLLQAKRLYPNEQTDLDAGVQDPAGFNILFKAPEELEAAMSDRTFRFSDASRYRALSVDDEQYKAIAEYEERFEAPIHYLLYNPLQVPSFTVFPLGLDERAQEPACTVGCRVIPSRAMRSLLEHSGVRCPSYELLSTILPSDEPGPASRGGWRLEDFVSQRLLACKDGVVDDGPEYRNVLRIFREKVSPISAAVSIAFDMP